MKIALVHDHLMEFGGAERVFVALKKMFPEAHVYTAAYDKDVVQKNIPDFDTWNVHTSWASNIPFFKKLYSPLRFLTPWIWQSFDFSIYDLVISSSGWFMSKGIITKPKTKHISYIHHQPRYLYYYETAMEWQRYLPVKIYAHFVNHFLRMWDYVGSQRPDVLIANSKETQSRIQKFYRRDSVVVYPPVQLPQNVDLKLRKPEYFVTLSRLARAKNIDVMIKAANHLKIPLKIVGKGRDEEYLRSLAGNTIEFMGNLPDSEFETLYKGAKAFLCTAVDEEFGIAPVEAMGYGVPVIAYASGGLKETVKNGENGMLFNELTIESLSESILKMEKQDIKEYKDMCLSARKCSEKFSWNVFQENIKKIVVGQT